MEQCDKRQKVVKRNNGETQYRCMNKESDNMGKEVVEEICAACPVRVLLNKQRPCKDKPIQSTQSTGITEKEILNQLTEGGFDVSDLHEEDSPDYPALTTQIINYKNALVRWQKEGRPTRSDEQVKKLFEKHCQTCNWYDSTKGRCKGCGCVVSLGGLAVTNKLRMATERCPQGKF
jgi:hypothetical protein